MLQLKPMSETTFTTYLNHAVDQYAQEKVMAGSWPQDQAQMRAKQIFQMLLPDGVLTKDQYLYDIQEDEQPIGMIWLAKRNENPTQAFIFDFNIDAQHQNKGLGRQALQLADEQASTLGFSAIALHVFGHNKRARHLYETSGYEVTDLVMEKKLR